MSELPFVVIGFDHAIGPDKTLECIVCTGCFQMAGRHNCPFIGKPWCASDIRLDNLAAAFNDPSTRDKALEWAREYGARK